MSEQKLVPELRFPEFEGEWLFEELSKVADVYDGTHQTPSYTDNGVPFVSVENIEDIENTQKFISQKDFDRGFKTKPRDGDILMTRITAGIIGSTALVKSNSPLAYYVSLALVRPQSILPPFVNFRINTGLFKHELYKRIIHVAFPKKINLGDIKKCAFSYPKTKAEQQKIADFLFSVDIKLVKLSRKKTLLEDYKRGLMQQIFSQKLRFKQDDGSEFPEWEYFELGEILEYEQPTKYLVNSTEYDDSYLVPVLTAGKTFILGYTNETNGIYEPMNEVIIFDDFTTASKFVDFRFKAKSSAMKILKPKDKHTSLRVIYEFMQLLKFPIGEHKRYWISEFQYFEIPTPCFAEQQKIADFLSSFDKKIDVVSKQIEQLETFKKGLLQKLFV